jgi:hypothetical protein
MKNNVPPYKGIKGKIFRVCFLTEHHAMKAYWGSGDISSRILDLGTKCKWSTSRSGCFTPRDRAAGSLWKEAGWAPEPVWTRW